MAQFNISKVNALPEVLAPNTLYFVNNAVSGQLELHVSDKDGTSTKHAIVKSEVESMIQESVAAIKPIAVADIAARDSLQNVNINQLVLVTDASGDDTVTSGAAMYFKTEGGYQKIAEYESLDLVLTWDGISGKPNSDVSAIDTAVANSHTHSNKALLDTLALNEHNALTFSYGEDENRTTVELGSASIVVPSVGGVGGSAGLMTATDKEKLDGIEAGAEVNENVFANVKVGVSTITASTKTDTVELASTTNALTLATEGNKVNFSIANAVVPAGGEDVTGTAGLMTGVEKAKLAAIEEGAQVNENVFGNVQVGDVTIVAANQTDTVKFAGNGAISAAADADAKTVTFSIAESQASTGGQGGQAGTMSAQQAEDLNTVKAQKQFLSVAGNTGTATATTVQDTLNIVGAGVVNVDAADKTVTISVPVAVAPGDNVEAANGLMTGAEKAKLAGIEAGAQVNQNAFAVLNAGVGSFNAAEASDSITITGAGAVSTEVSADTLTITVAEAQSAGVDTQAKAGLMSASDKAKLDKFTFNDGVLSYDGTAIGNNLIAEEW